MGPLQSSWFQVCGLEFDVIIVPIFSVFVFASSTWQISSLFEQVFLLLKLDHFAFKYATIRLSD